MSPTSIVYPCGHCGLRHEIDASMAGKSLQCSHCGAAMVVPIPRARASADVQSVDSPSIGTTGRDQGRSVSTSEPHEYKHECVECGKRYLVPERLFGQRIACRRCGALMQFGNHKGSPPQKAALTSAGTGRSLPSGSQRTGDASVETSPSKSKWLNGLESPPIVPKTKVQTPPLRTFVDEGSRPAGENPFSSGSSKARNTGLTGAEPGASGREIISLTESSLDLVPDFDEIPAPESSKPTTRLSTDPPRSAPKPPASPAKPVLDEFDPYDFEDDEETPASPRMRFTSTEDDLFSAPAISTLPRSGFTHSPRRAAETNGGAKIAGLLGGGFGGLGLILLLVLRFAGVFQQGALIQGEKSLEFDIGEYAVKARVFKDLCASIRDLPSAKAANPRAVVILKEFEDISRRMAPKKIRKERMELLKMRFSAQINSDMFTAGAELARASREIPGAEEALAETFQAIRRLVEVEKELQIKYKAKPI